MSLYNSSLNWKQVQHVKGTCNARWISYRGKISDIFNLRLRICWFLKAGRSRDRFSKKLMNFSNLPYQSSRIMARGMTQSLTEMSTRNLLGGKVRPTLKADNLSAFYEVIVWKMWDSQNFATLCMSARPFTRIVSFYIRFIPVANSRQCPALFSA
jgi:hypothetical protein